MLSIFCQVLQCRAEQGLGWNAIRPNSVWTCSILIGASLSIYFIINICCNLVIVFAVQHIVSWCVACRLALKCIVRETQAAATWFLLKIFSEGVVMIPTVQMCIWKRKWGEGKVLSWQRLSMNVKRLLQRQTVCRIQMKLAINTEHKIVSTMRTP